MFDNQKKYFLNTKGFTLVESLVGMGLLGIVMVAGIQGYDYVKKSSVQLTTLNTTENRVAEIIQSIKSNISQQIISYPGSVDTQNTLNTSAETGGVLGTAIYIDTILTTATLPMAWSLQSDSDVTNCTNCPGRYGYIITAEPNYGGLYRVTIKFTHKDWPDARKYTFLVSK